MSPITKPPLPSTTVMVFPLALNGPLKSLFGPSSTTLPPAADTVVAPPTVITEPACCVTSPPVLVTANSPPVCRLPRVAPPAVSVIVVLPATVTLPLDPWLNWPLTVRLPCVATVPPVWLKSLTAMSPALLSLPPLCASEARLTPPLPTSSAPLACTRPPPLPPRLPISTGPVWAGATAPAVSKRTTTPAGITTLATLARSGTAPPAQLAGSNQLPLAPPVQVTLPSRVMSAVVLPPVVVSL